MRYKNSYHTAVTYNCCCYRMVQQSNFFDKLLWRMTRGGFYDDARGLGRGCVWYGYTSCNKSSLIYLHFGRFEERGIWPHFTAERLLFWTFRFWGATASALLANGYIFLSVVADLVEIAFHLLTWWWTFYFSTAGLVLHIVVIWWCVFVFVVCIVGSNELIGGLCLSRTQYAPWQKKSENRL